jgi:hypothetical protein
MQPPLRYPFKDEAPVFLKTGASSFFACDAQGFILYTKESFVPVIKRRAENWGSKSGRDHFNAFPAARGKISNGCFQKGQEERGKRFKAASGRHGL